MADYIAATEARTATRRVLPGDRLTSGSDPIAELQASGCVLIALPNTTAETAAVIALSWRRKGNLRAAAAVMLDAVLSLGGSGFLKVDGTNAMMADLNVNEHKIVCPTAIDFSTSTPSLPHREARLWYDFNDRTFAFETDILNAALQIGEEERSRAWNMTGTQINNMHVCYVNGSHANDASVALACANSYDTSLLLGVATVDIPDRGFGYITSRGKVRDVDTRALEVGPVYLSPTVPGDLTIVKPTAPDKIVLVGYVFDKGLHGVLTVFPMWIG